MSINRELSQLASFIDVQESNNFIGISTGGTYTVGIGSSSVTISSNGTVTAPLFVGATGSSLIDHIDLQDEGNLVGTGFTTLNFVGAAVTVTQGVSGVATITVDSAVVGGEDGAVQFASGGTLTGISTLLFADSTNHRIGIGTSNPQYKLHVTGGGIDLNSSSTSLSDGVRVGRFIKGHSGQKLVISNTGDTGVLLEGTASATLTVSINGIVFGSAPIKFYSSEWTINNDPTITLSGVNNSANIVGNIGLGSTQPTATLDVNGTVNVSGVSTFQGNVNLGDNDKIILGDGNDLQIYHDPNEPASYISDQGEGQLRILTNKLQVKNTTDNATSAVFNSGGAVTLNYDNSTKFQTVGGGVSISSGTASTATIYGPGNLLIDPAPVDNNGGIVRIKGDLYVDGTTTEINSTTLTIDDLNVVVASGATNGLTADGAGLSVAGAGATIKYNYNGGSEQWVFNKAPYYNTDRLLTTADEGTGNGLDADTLDGQEGTHYLDYSNFVGVATDSSLLSGISSTSFLRSDVADIKTSGNLKFNDGVQLRFGTDNDLQLYHSGTASMIVNTGTGNIRIRNSVDLGDVVIQTDDGSGGSTDYFRADGSTGESILYHYGNQKLNTTGYGVTVTGGINVSGVATATDFNSASDENLKTNIRTIEDPLAKVVQIRGVNFDWKETQRPALGVIAQEVEKVLPELVTDNGTKTVNYNGLIGLLIEAVKAQQEEIDMLKSKIK